MKGNSPTRKDKARPSLEMVSMLGILLDKRHPRDWLFMFAVRSWSYTLASGVTKAHVQAVLHITDGQFEDSLRRLRFRGFLSWDKETGYMVITPLGRRSLLGLQTNMSGIWKRVQDFYKKDTDNETDGSNDHLLEQ